MEEFRCTSANRWRHQNKFYNSVVSAQIPGRADFLDKMAQDKGSSSKLASLKKLARLFEWKRMTEAKVTTFKTDVVEAAAKRISLLLAGPFALVADGKP